jgi:hypothetical protein
LDACVRGSDGRCGWAYRPCLGSAATPAPAAGPELNADVAEITKLLDDKSPARRVAACKLVRGKVRVYGVKALSDAVTPALIPHLSDTDPEVRRWVVLALRVLDDRSLPALEARLPNERDQKVANTLGAVIRQFEDARKVEAGTKAHPCQSLKPAEIMKWPVRELCDPIGHYPPVLFSLPDGTHVYKENATECFRGKKSDHCYLRCLPGSARIDTPHGPRRVDSLREGETVWSADEAGRRVAVPLARVSSLEVGHQHRLVRIALADGRAVEASWYHPTSTGQFIGELNPGDELDGSAVASVTVVPYFGRRTFDLLPIGPTGFYFAEGVLLGSSLSLDSH